MPWNSVLGRALLRFLVLVVEGVRPLGPLGGWRSPGLANSVVCHVVVEVTT